MKKLVYAMLAAAISVGAVAPAGAWGYTKCKVWSDMDVATVSNQMISENCHAFIVGEGMISRGARTKIWGVKIKDEGYTGRGQTWKEAFPNANYVAIDGKDTYLQEHGRKFTIRVKDHETLRTKKIDKDDIDDYLSSVKYHKEVPNYVTNSWSQELIKWKMVKDKK